MNKQPGLDRQATVAAKDVQEGDMVDLENDPFTRGAQMEALFEYEYAVVLGPAEVENRDTVVVHTDQGSFGMPPDHPLRRGGEQ